MKTLFNLRFLKAFALICILLYGTKLTYSQTGIYVPSMQTSDNLISNFLNSYGIQGATVAIAKDGKLVYLRAFGYADIDGQELTQPYHMLRIASCSKPITATAIIKLWEEGLLDLDAKVFGEGGILNVDPYYSNANITDDRIYDITVRNLLEHATGWNRDIPMTPDPLPPYPYGFPTSDPIVFPLHVTLTLGESNPVTERALVKFLIERGLDVDPGTEYHYSNIGFVILGEIIRIITGMEYEDYVKSEILNPIGAYDMHIGKNLLEDKMEREGEYLNTYTTLSCYGTGEYVPWQYGGFNLEAMDAHGGWIATARDYVRFILSVDKFNTKPDILLPASIDTMTSPSATNQYYAKGWQVNQYNNWWHTGSIDGSRSIIVRSSGGFAWAVILNEGADGNFWNDFDNLIWNCIASTSSFPTFDLFNLPLQNSSEIQFSNNNQSSVQVSWNNGDGDKRLLIVREGNPTNKFPLDGTDYNANSTFGSGDDLGNGNYVVYSGSENSVTLTNLSPNANYYLRLFEFNKNSTTGGNALYLLANSEIDSINLSTTAVLDDKFTVSQYSLSQNYPNPFNPSTKIQFRIAEFGLVNLKVFDVLGNEVATLVNEEKPAGTYEVDFDASKLTSGLYFYKLQAGGFVQTKKMILLR